VTSCVLKIRRGVGYDQALAWQQETVAELKKNPDSPEVIWMIEHTPLITLGASGDGRYLLSSADELERDGIDFRKARRGGDVTYHGPGQWTVYPILRLENFCKDLHRYMRLLEECVIRYLATHGLRAGRVEGKTGVWVGQDKLSAVGVAVSRWISFHGVAVNIQPDLAQFTRHIVPCGISADEASVGSLAKSTGMTYDMETEAANLAASFSEVLQREITT